MLQKVFLVVLLALCFNGHSQYKFEGRIAENIKGKTVYLSIIEDYRKLSRPYMEQIIKRITIDSLGVFKFTGNNLSPDNRIYRIHIDECDTGNLDSNHFFGRCENSRSILFIANNRDTIAFPTSFADEVLCEVTSTNARSSVFLEIDRLKEEMAFDFHDFPSQASRKLNTKKWFATLQEFGQSLEEPLAELYIFDFLSDKRNETYPYYLKDLGRNDYYSELGQRLETKYPNTVFTELYQTEIATDLFLVTQNKTSSSDWKWILGSLLALSLVLNLYLLSRQKSFQKNRKTNSFDILTAQEQNIVNEILKDKTNKEIASDLFISLSTVKTHINNLYKKLHVSSREDIKKLFP